MTDSTPGAAAVALGDNAAPPASAPPPAAPPAAPAPPSANWTQGWDPADAGMVEKRGWKDPKDLFKSYVNLEKMNSGEKIVFPKDAEDKPAWENLYTRMGRPDSPEKYKFPDGTDPAIAKELAPKLHEMGLTQSQVQALALFDVGRNKAAIEQQQAAWVADQDRAMQTLTNEWGNKSPEQIELNRRAMRAYGIDVDAATRGMAAVGAEKFMRLLNAAGRAVREGNELSTPVDDTQLGFGMTPNRAAAEIEGKKNDPVFWKKYQNGDKSAMMVMDRLYKQMAGAA